MAVPKRRKTRARRNMGRSHNALDMPTFSIDQTSGETHCRHHITADGYYRGRQLIVPKEKPEVKKEEQE